LPSSEKGRIKARICIATLTGGERQHYIGGGRKAQGRKISAERRFTEAVKGETNKDVRIIFDEERGEKESYSVGAVGEKAGKISSVGAGKMETRESNPEPKKIQGGKLLERASMGGRETRSPVHHKKEGKILDGGPEGSFLKRFQEEVSILCRRKKKKLGNFYV